MNPVTDMIFDTLQDARELQDKLARLARWQYVTRKQANILADMIAPSLPCLISLSCRAKKGSVYVKISEGESAKTFRLDPSARVHPLASA